VDIHVRARGEATYGADFLFLGTAPRQWWRDYRNYVVVESPGILLQSDGSRWRVFLSGIRTSLRDISGRERPLNVALAGAAGDPETGAARTMIAAFLAEIAGDTASPTLGAELQSRFTGEVIERLRSLTLVDDRAAAAADEVGALVREAVGKLPVTGRGTAGPPAYASWAGDVTDARARDAFLARAEALLGGGTGLAAVCNLAPTVAHVEPLAAEPGGAVALINGVPPLRGIVDITPAPVPNGPGPGPKAAAGPAPAGLSLRLIVLGLIVASSAVVWWVWRRWPIG
jgi:hypothetical protein